MIPLDEDWREEIKDKTVTQEYVEQRLSKRLPDAFKVSDTVISEERDGFTVYANGTTRNNDVDHLAFDLISPYGLEALAKVYREGGDRHGDRNWEKGQPEGVVLNHALAHIIKYMKGDRTEDHLAKCAWAMFALIHYRDRPNTQEPKYK